MWNREINNRLLNTVDQSIRDAVPHWTQVKPSKTIKIDTSPGNQRERHTWEWDVGLGIMDNEACLVVFNQLGDWICVVNEGMMHGQGGILHRYWRNDSKTNPRAMVDSEEAVNFWQPHCNDVAEKLLKELTENKMEEMLLSEPK